MNDKRATVKNPLLSCDMFIHDSEHSQWGYETTALVVSLSMLGEFLFTGLYSSPRHDNLNALVVFTVMKPEPEIAQSSPTRSSVVVYGQPIASPCLQLSVVPAQWGLQLNAKCIIMLC